MNDAILSERLRALREPAPRNGFEERLQQALAREAQAPRAPALRTLLRARRWGGRVGLGMVIACGATAAAAAGGIWAAVAYSERSAVAPELDAPAAAARNATHGAGAAKLTASPEPTPSAAPTPTELPALEPATAPTAPSAADAPAAAPALDAPAPRLASPSRPDRARALPQERARLVPFELPARGTPARGAADPAARLEPRPLPEARGAHGERAARELPALPSRADRGSRGEKSASERGDAPPGHDLTRERGNSGKNADRGSERAREVREKK